MVAKLVDYHASREKMILQHLMIIGDHAANTVPTSITLGVDENILNTHRAVDLGTQRLSKQLHRDNGCAIANACVSRLVVDLNRHRDEVSTIPMESDGIDIPGNALDEMDHEKRLCAYYDSYHWEIGQLLDQERPDLIIFLHSFTPQLTEGGTPRPWHFGIMYDQDPRAAKLALSFFADTEMIAGDQLPYSGRIYNSSFQRHAESRNVPYIGLEVRQDLLNNKDNFNKVNSMLSRMSQSIITNL